MYLHKTILGWISILLGVHVLLNSVVSFSASVLGLEGLQFEFSRVTFLIDMEFSS